MAATVKNESSVANQALQQTIHGDVNFHTVENQAKEQEECLGQLFLTDPEEVKSALKGRKGNRVKGTCEWFKQTAEFAAWRDGVSRNSNIFWLSGHPGTGKSTLAIFLVESLETDLAENNDAILAYFFCDTSAHDQNTAVAILRGLIYQLCRSQISLLDRWFLPQWRVKKEKLLTSFDALWSIFFSIAIDPSTGQKFFILDALDECDSESQHLLLHHFEQCFRPSTLESQLSNVHFLITSRPYAEIRETLEQFPHRDLASFPQVQLDVESFVKERVTKLAQKKRYTPKLQQEVTDILTSKAEGTFLWVGLACAELERLSAKAGLDRIKHFPAGLTSIYDTLLQQALRQASDLGEDPNMVEQVLRTVAVALEPITLEELAVVCRLHEYEEAAERLLFTENTIDLCRLVVVVDGNYVRLLHKSVKDFLFTSRIESMTCRLDSHANVAYRCVDLLISDYHARQNGTTTEFDDCFVEYSAQHWAEHASLAQDKYEVSHNQYEFFSYTSPSREAWSTFSLALGEDIPLHYSLFHVAARWNIIPLVDHMETDQFLNDGSTNAVSRLEDLVACLNRIQGNPLKIAVATGHVKVLCRLLRYRLNKKDDKLVFDTYAVPANRASSKTSFWFPVTTDIVMTAVCTSFEMLKTLLSFRENEITLSQDIVEEAALDRSTGQNFLELFRDKFSTTVPNKGNIILAAISNPNVNNAMIVCLISDAIRSGSSLDTRRILEAISQLRDAPIVRDALQILRTAGVPVTVDLDLMKALSLHGSCETDVLSILLDAAAPALDVSQELVEYITQFHDLETLLKFVDIECVAVTEDLLALAVMNEHCADSMTSVLLSQAPDIKITEYVLKQAVSNRHHAAAMLPILLERGLAEDASASRLLRRAIDEHSDIFGVTQALASDTPALLRQIDDSVFQALASEYGSRTGLINLDDARNAMTILLTNPMFHIEMTAAVVVAVAATSTPEEYLRPRFLETKVLRLVHSNGFWEFPIRAFSTDMIFSILTKMGNTSSAVSSLIKSAIAVDRGEIIKILLFEPSHRPVRAMIISSALYEAAACGNLPIVQMLLDHGMSLQHLRLGSSSNLVRAAASSGNVEVLNRLLEMGLEIRAEGDAETCPLAAAIGSISGRETSGPMVRLLLQHGADPNSSNHDYGNALQQAAIVGDLSAVESLLVAGANVNARGGKYGSALQAAVCAFRHENEITQLMIKHGADLNAQGGEYDCALYAALFQNRLRLANLLLRRGADLPEGVVNHVLTDTSLSKPTLTFVLRHKASVVVRDELGWSCLHIATSMPAPLAATPSVVRLLHEAGADLHARGRANRTPLIEASARGQYEIVQWLLSAGASVYDRDLFGCTALHYAVRTDLDASRALIEAGADIAATDGYGSTILHWASSSGRASNVRWVVEAVRPMIETVPGGLLKSQTMVSVSSFVNHLDFLRRSAMHLALYGSYTDIVETLLLEGAQTNLPDEHGMSLESWINASHSQREAWASVPSAMTPTADELLDGTYTPLRIITRAIREYGHSDDIRFYRWLAHCLVLQKQYEDAITALEQCILPGSGNSRDAVLHYATCNGCYEELISGIRHRCKICADCNLCNNCMEGQYNLLDSTCCNGHETSFLQVPGLSWAGLQPNRVNPRGESKNQWLERLDQTLGTF